MRKSLDRLNSPALGRTVHLWRYGHYGVPLVVFPSSAGLAHEWEAGGLVAALRPLIDAGRVKLYCTESNVSEAWMDRSRPPQWRIARHRAFERYVLDELVPLVREDCRTPEIGVWCAGMSLGAFYAAKFALKQPEIFRWALCLSGRYDATWMTGGFDAIDVYYNNPVAFVPNLRCAELERVRLQTSLTLVCGRGPWEGRNADAPAHFARILRSRDIPHQLDIWGHDVAHDWKWWCRQAVHHLSLRLNAAAPPVMTSAFG